MSTWWMLSFLLWSSRRRSLSPSTCSSGPSNDSTADTCTKHRSHSLPVLTSASFEARRLVTINSRQKETTFITKDPWRGATWSQTPLYISLYITHHTLLSHYLSKFTIHFSPLKLFFIGNVSSSTACLLAINTSKCHEGKCLWVHAYIFCACLHFKGTNG